jgi:hypothetical protein
MAEEQEQTMQHQERRREVKISTLSKINRILGIGGICLYGYCAVINAIAENWPAALGWGCALLMALNSMRLEKSCDFWRKMYWRTAGFSEDEEE